MTTKEKRHKYYLTNRKKNIKYRKEYYKKHSKQIIEYSSKYYYSHHAKTCKPKKSEEEKKEYTKKYNRYYYLNITKIKRKLKKIMFRKRSNPQGCNYL